ncbi:MAG: HEAT repeat domain-containing protein [bacterium]
MRFIFLSIVLITLSTHVFGQTHRSAPTIDEQPGTSCIGQTHRSAPTISALEDKDEAIRMQAAETLGDISDSEVHAKEAVAALINALNDPMWRVKRNAIISLGKIGSPAAIPALLECLKDENWIIRGKAVHTLGEIGSLEAADAIIRMRKDEDESVQKEAISSLGKIRAVKAIPMLIDILTHSTEDEGIIFGGKDSTPEKYMNLAALSLIEIGTPSTIPLIRILMNKNPHVRQYAAYALGEIRDIRAISPLIEALSEENELPRRDISSALVNMGTTAVPAVLPCLNTNDMDLKGCLVWILGEIGDKRAAQPLIKILTSAKGAASMNDQSILKKTVWALGKIGDKEALPILISWLKNDYRLEESVIIALGRISDEKTVRLFASALQRDDAANLSWEKINDPGIDVLIAATRDQDVEIRRCAVAALGKTRNEKAVEPLIALLNDDDWRTQRNAVIGLGKIGEIANKSVPCLINLLNPSLGIPPTIWTVRGNVAIALGKMNDQSIMPQLIKSLKDEDGFTRCCAAEAIGNLKRRATLAGKGTLTVDKAIVPLIELLNDTDASVQGAAVSALIDIGSSCIPCLLESIDRTNANPPTTNIEQGQALSLQPTNKIHAFTIFGKLHAAQAVDMLINNLLSEESPSNKDKKIAGSAARALGEIGDRRAIEPLIKKLKDVNLTQQWMLPQVIEAVGKLKGEEAIPYLIGFLQQEGAPLSDGSSLAEGEIASVTTSALVNIGTPCVPSLIKALDHGNDMARANATLALGQLKDKRAVPALTAMLKNEEWYVRSAAVIALGEIADKSALEPLASIAMGDKNEDVRVYASNALGKIDDNEVIKFLMIALDDPNPDIQFNSALALGERGYIEGIQLLIEYLNAKDTVIRKIVINRLTKIGKIAIPALIKAMGHENNVIRKVATDVLTTMGDDAIIQLLQVFQTHDSGKEIVRWYAAIALGSLLEKTQDTELQEKIIMILSRNLNDDSWYGRGGAAIALGNISTNQDALIEALLKGLNDINGVVRTTTVEALGKIGNPRALKMLAILSNNDPESCVRVAAKAAIDRIQKQVE